jgi:hypothetical protein
LQSAKLRFNIDAATQVLTLLADTVAWIDGDAMRCPALVLKQLGGTTTRCMSIYVE